MALFASLSPAPRLRAVAVVSLVLALNSCTGGTNGAPKESTLRIGVGVGPSAQGGGLNVLAEMLYAEPLVALDTRGTPVARLAEEWRWENDGKDLRIMLRAGTKLHDGRTLDAASARHFLTAKIDELRKSGLRSSFDGVTTIEAVGDRGLLVRLKKPDAFLVAELNNANIVDPESPDIGTGPFQLISRRPLKVRRFSEHHRGAPAITNVEITAYDGQRAAWAALLRNEIDAVQEVTRDSVEFLQRSSDIHIVSSLRPYYWALTFNLEHPTLKRAEVRRAISLGINREEIVHSVMRGHAAVATDPLWPLFWAHPGKTQLPPFDPHGAKQLIGRKVTFRCLFYGEDPLFERMALMIQRQLGEVGVQLELEPAPLDEMQKRIRQGHFESFLLQAASGRALDWTYRFWHSPAPSEPALFLTGYSGADQVLDALKSAYSDDQVRARVVELQRRFLDDPPAVFIAWQKATRAVSTRFDISEADKQDVFANIWQWKPVSHPE